MAVSEGQNSNCSRGESFSMTQVLKAAALYDLKCGVEDQSLREDLGLEAYIGADGTVKVQEPIVAGTASRKPENRYAAALEKIEQVVEPWLESDRASSTMSTASEIGTDEGIDLESTDDLSSEAEQKSKIKCSENVETLICNSPVLVRVSEERDYSNDVRFLGLLDALLPCIKSD